MKTLKKVAVAQDEDGNWYVMPDHLLFHFRMLIYEEQYKEIERQFGKYKTGGEINLVQLWAEI